MTRKGSADGRATAPWLVGDIGATNLRLALARPADGGFSLDAVERWPIAGIDGIEAALERYLAGIASARPTVGALAIAGPVTGDALAITNAGWRWSCDAVRTQFGFRQFVCLNDAEAQALALPHLGAADFRPIGRTTQNAIRDAPRLLIAPGSGLGVAALMSVAGCLHAIAGEGGHATVAPQTAPERDLAATLAARFGGHASWERILSGPGIAAAYGWIEERNGIAVSGAMPETVVRWALDGDSLARSAVDMFIGLLGSYAGDLALIFGARGGVFIGGGIAPAIADMVASGTFRARFESKGRFSDYLRAIPTSIVLHSDPGLIGAAAYLANLMNDTGDRA